LSCDSSQECSKTAISRAPQKMIRAGIHVGGFAVKRHAEALVLVATRSPEPPKLWIASLAVQLIDQARDRISAWNR
jgi:hypothetical protein